jgi:aminoglycoside phosphotransferase (APT) family kinase protein
MNTESGQLVASGRAADVFVEGAGRVRRRYRCARDSVSEAEVMRHARSRGFPAPEVFDAAGSEIVMERIEGRSMLEDLARCPWRLRSHAELLAGLHDRLHQIVAPPWLESQFGTGRALLHLDLHLDNVILTGSGPCVIDWTNATAGPPAADITQTWVLIASSLVPGNAWQRAIARLGRGLFLAAFLRQFDHPTLLSYLPAVAQARLIDENVQPPEQRVIRRMLARADPTPAEDA